MAEPSIPRSLLNDAPQWPITNDLRMTMQIHGADKYPAKAHVRRVAEKMGVGEGLIALAGTKNVNWPNSDMPAPFRQDSYFMYVTGCNESDCYVTYSIEHDHLTLWLPPVDDDPRHVVYYGNGSTVEEAMEKYDIDEARYIEKPKHPDTQSAWARPLLSRFSHIRGLKIGLTSTVFNTIVHGIRDGGWDESKASKMRIFLLDEHTTLTNGQTKLKMSLRTAMDACRMIKDQHEIELIRKANAITAEAHVSAFKGMCSFSSEADIEAAYRGVCIARRAKEQAYDPIVGSGANASVLHYSENLADFGDGQTVVLDAGCEVERYASDVTRTFPINEESPGYWPSKEAKEIYDLVEKIQETCIKQMKPGHRYIESSFTAHRLVIEGLVKLGIIKEGHDPDELFVSGVSQFFLPHGLGHHLGLECHDVSIFPPPPLPRIWSPEVLHRLREAYIEWSPISATKAAQLTNSWQFNINNNCHMSVDGPNAPVLEAGMVVTVEPGIYFSKFLIKALMDSKSHSPLIDEDVLVRYIPVGGVRIEDDILITKTGYENLTTAPKGDEMLKIIRESAAAQST